MNPRSAHADLPGRGPGGTPLRLHYLDWGGQGAPILLLHGLASSCRIWDLTAPLLARHFRIIAVDQRGHGLSGRPDSDYTFDELCGDLEAFLASLALERPLLVGHSWGGSVVLQYAAERSESVRGIALVDGGMAEVSALLSWEEAEKIMRPPEIDGANVDRFLDFASRWPNLRDIWSPQLQQMLLSNFLIRDGRVYRRLHIENHMKVARAIYDQKLTQLYPRVKAPVLLVPADRTPETDQEKIWQDARNKGLQVALALLPDPRLHTMNDCPHDIPIFRPQELAAAIASFAEALT